MGPQTGGNHVQVVLFLEESVRLFCGPTDPDMNGQQRLHDPGSGASPVKRSPLVSAPGWVVPCQSEIEKSGGRVK